MRKIIALLLVVVLTATAAVGATLAYLTDRDAEANVFTIGNVDIELTETFGQGAKLLPGKDIEKEPFITNTGKNPAWVWATIAIPSKLDDSNASNNVIHFNYAKDTVSSEKWIWQNEGGYRVTKVAHDGIDYNVYSVLYGTALQPGQFTEAVMTKVYMDYHIDIDPNGDWYHVDKGVVSKKLWEAKDGNPVMYVAAYAVQTEGFNSVQEAFEAYKGQWSNNDNSWMAWGTPATVVEAAGQVSGEAAAEILEDLAAGNDLVIDEKVDIITFDTLSVDAQGATVELNGTGAGAYGYLAFAPGKGEDTSVRNLNVTGSGFVEVGHHGNGGGDYTVSNVNIQNMTTTVCVYEGGNPITSAFAQYGNATLTDCVMTGTVSCDPTYKAYDAAFTNGTKTNINGGEYGAIYLSAQAHVTITDADVDSITSCAITTRNLGMLTIRAGAKVGTINLNPTGSYSPALTIEDGATVGSIVYNGVTYTQDQWVNP